MADDVAPAPRRPAPRGGRVPPHDLHAEESLLGAMMLEAEAIATAAGVLRADDFYKPAHAHIFDAIHALYASGQPVDPVTVADELRRSGLLETVGGHQVLVDVMASTPATTNAAGYARIVEEHALLRRLIGVAGEIAEIGYGMPEDIAKALDRAESMVYDVNQRRVIDSTAKIEDLLGLNLDRLEHLYGRGDSITGVPTGYVDLDELLSGLQPSTLVVVGARPSMGKCVAGDTLVVDPATGELRTAAQLHRAGTAGEAVSVLTLEGGRVVETQPSAFVDDGIKPVYRVRTSSGREVRTTASHPFLTPEGWRPLADLAPGRLVGVPATIPVFGTLSLPADEVVLLAHLVMAPGEDEGCPKLWTENREVASDIEYRGRASASASPTARCRAAAAPGTWSPRRSWSGWPAATTSPPRWRPAGCRRRCSACPATSWPGSSTGRWASAPRCGVPCTASPGGWWSALAAAAWRATSSTCCCASASRPGCASRWWPSTRRRGWPTTWWSTSRPSSWPSPPTSACSATRPSWARWSPTPAWSASVPPSLPPTPPSSPGARSPPPCPRRSRQASTPPGRGRGRRGCGGRRAVGRDRRRRARGRRAGLRPDRPQTHNFVAADVFVHNTSFALGMGAHAGAARQPARAAVQPGDGRAGAVTAPAVR